VSPQSEELPPGCVVTIAGALAGFVGGMIYGGRYTTDGEGDLGLPLVAYGLAGAVVGLIVCLIGFAVWQFIRRR
jgi:hypothetical protein